MWPTVNKLWLSFDPPVGLYCFWSFCSVAVNPINLHVMLISSQWSPCNKMLSHWSAVVDAYNDLAISVSQHERSAVKSDTTKDPQLNCRLAFQTSKIINTRSRTICIVGLPFQDQSWRSSPRSNLTPPKDPTVCERKLIFGWLDASSSHKNAKALDYKSVLFIWG